MIGLAFHMIVLLRLIQSPKVRPIVSKRNSSVLMPVVLMMVIVMMLVFDHNGLGFMMAEPDLFGRFLAVIIIAWVPIVGAIGSLLLIVLLTAIVLILLYLLWLIIVVLLLLLLIVVVRFIVLIVMGWGQLLVLDILVLMSSVSSEKARLKFVVAPEQSTPIGSDVQVDQGLVDNFSIVVGSGLKGDEGVDVYRSHGDTPTGGVGVDRRAGTQEILGLTGILIGILIG